MTVGRVLGPVLGLVAAGLTVLGFGADRDSAVRLPPLALALLVLAGVVGLCAGVGLVVGLTAGVSERYAVDPPGPGRAVRASLRNWWVWTPAGGLPPALPFVLATPVGG